MSEKIINRTCLFINRRSPYGSSHAQEALDMAYTLSAFEHKVSLIFMDDGVLQIIREQDPSSIGMKNISSTFRAWEDYEIEHIYVEKESLEMRGVKETDLLIVAEIIDADHLGKIIEKQDFIFND